MDILLIFGQNNMAKQLFDFSKYSFEIYLTLTFKVKSYIFNTKSLNNKKSRAWHLLVVTLVELSPFI